jgi:hypothetical protein
MAGVMSTPSPFTYSLANAMAFTERALCQPDERIHLLQARMSLHDFARNSLYLGMKGDWLVMLDTDLAFDADVIARLVATAHKHNLDIVSGVYCYKRPPHYPVIYMWNEELQIHQPIADWDRSSELIQVDSAGGGLLYLSRRILDRVRDEFKCGPFDRIGNSGEDHSLFRRVAKLGVKAWAAPKIEAQHLEYLGLAPSTAYHGPFPGVATKQVSADVIRTA